MKNSREANPSNSNPNPFNMIPHNKFFSNHSKQDFFCFLKNEEKPPISSSFFSENGLSQNILKVTDAEPDICLEVFYALYHVLLPQIKKNSSVLLQNAWISFIGNAILRGVLCPPEKLISKKRPKDLKRILSQSEGESQIFQDLDRVLGSIIDLKQNPSDSPDQLDQKEEIMAS